ncbi:AcrB/AcrD/AcrF family protein, partial [Candidatus Marinamargulisbacteria bacterium SCGC AG-439-L15]
LILRLKRVYEKRLKICIKRRYQVALFFIALFIGTLFYAFNFMNFVLFPKSVADQFVIQCEFPINTPLNKTFDNVKPIETLLLNLSKDELNGFTTRVGSLGDFNYMTEKENKATILVDLTPSATRKRTAQSIMSDLKRRTKALSIDGTIRFLIEGGGPPVGRAITVRIIGDNNTQRNELSNEVYTFLSSTPGIKDLKRNDTPENDQLQLNIDYDAAARLGITIDNIITIFRTAYVGAKVTSVRYEDEDVDFRVRLDQERRQDIATLKQLMIPNKQGRLIPIKEVAQFETVPGDPNYYHYNTQRAVTIEGDVDDKVITSLQVTKTIQKQFDLRKEWPGMRFEFGGEGKETQKSIQDLNRSFLAAIFGIFLILVLLFNSILQPFLVLSAIPFGIIGVIIAFAIHGQDIGFLAGIGTVGLCGVVVNDSLVMVNTINNKRRENKTTSIESNIIHGASTRFRPIILTSFTTIAGLLPLAYGVGGSDPFIAPMGLALGYGLFLSTPLTLFFLPSFYMILYDIREKFVSWGLLSRFK